LGLEDKKVPLFPTLKAKAKPKPKNRKRKSKSNGQKKENPRKSEGN
jgi:hypothetical protein